MRMRTAISRGQWHPWTAVSPLLELTSMAFPSVSDRGKPVFFFCFVCFEAGIHGRVHCQVTQAFSNKEQRHSTVRHHLYITG